MPSRGTVVIPRGYLQQQPKPAKGNRDITNKFNKRGYRSQEALIKRRTDRNHKHKERSDLTRQIKKCLPKGEWKKKAHTTSQQWAWKAESLKNNYRHKKNSSKLNHTSKPIIAAMI